MTNNRVDGKGVWAPVNSANAFVHALLTRYRSGWDHPPALNLYWLRLLNPFVSIQHVYHQSQVSFAPRLSLTIVGDGSSSGDADNPAFTKLPRQSPAFIAQSFIFYAQSTTPQSEQPVLPIRQISVLREQLVRRLLTERQRVEIYPLLDGTAEKVKVADNVKVPEYVPQASKRALVVRRTSDITQDEAAPTKSVATPDDDFTRQPGVDLGPPLRAHPIHPGVDINQVTDQVIQTIDQRIIAQRERMGSI